MTPTPPTGPTPEPTPTPQAVAETQTVDLAFITPTYVEGLLANIKRLNAIVDRLPKTADGVPITPGMYVCFDAGQGCPEMRLHDMHVMQRVEFDSKTPSIELRTERQTDFSTGANRLYSTREAALAALEAAPAAGEEGT